MQFRSWCILFILLIGFLQHVSSLEVEWMKKNPKEAFEKLSNKNSFELQASSTIVELTAVQGSVTIYCAAERKREHDSAFKSSIFSTIKLNTQADDTKEWRLYLDNPLAEQASFEVTLEKAFAINNEFILTKQEHLQRTKKEDSSIHSHMEQQQTTTAQVTKVTRVFGGQRILWIRSIFNDTTPAIGWPTNPQVAWDNLQMLDKYFRQYSYNRSWVDLNGCNVTQVYTLSFNKSAISDGADPIRRESMGKAGYDGYRAADYDFIIVSFPTVQAYSWAGIGVVYGQFTWINAYSPDEIIDYVLLHEIGHNVGMSHSNSLISNENPKVSFGGSGSNDEYGDAFDNMGGGDVEFHWNIIKKQKIGWVNETSMRNISQSFSGYIDLYAFDQEINLGKQMAIYLPWHILSAPNILFYLTYRSSSVRSPRMASGAIEVRAGYKFYRTVDAYETNATHLIDTTPNSASGISDAMIALGQTYIEKGGYLTMIVSAISAKCDKNALNTTSCVLKGYLHYGRPMVSNSYTIRIMPQDLDTYNSSYTLATWTELRMIADVSTSDLSQETLHFFELGSRDNFAAQGHWGSFSQTSTGFRNISFTASNMKGAVQSGTFDIRVVSGKNYGGAWCDGPFNHNADFRSFRPIVDGSIAKELHVVVNEDLLGSAYNLRFTFFYFPINVTSGLYRFHTIAVDTNLVIGMSGYKFMYINRMENNMQFNLIGNNTVNGTIVTKYVPPISGMFLYRLVTISARSLTKIGSNQNTAQYQRVSDYELWINGTGSVNILYPYSITSKTVVEFEVQSNLVGKGGHYFSLQQTLQHNTNWYIEILPCRSNCNYTNNTFTYYGKTSLFDTYSLISIPIYKEYLQSKDEHRSLYISFTNVNGGEMTVRRIRFYESREILPTVCSDSGVRNSVIDYGAQNLRYIWSHRSRNNSNVYGFLNSTLSDGPVITGVALNDTVNVNLEITSSGSTIFNQTVALKYTIPVYNDAVSRVIPVYSSPRIAPRYSSTTSITPRNSTTVSPRGSGTITPRSSVGTITPRNSTAIVTPRTSTAIVTPTARNSSANGNNPSSPQTSTRVISFAMDQKSLHSITWTIFILGLLLI